MATYEKSATVDDVHIRGVALDFQAERGVTGSRGGTSGVFAVHEALRTLEADAALEPGFTFRSEVSVRVREPGRSQTRGGGQAGELEPARLELTGPPPEAGELGQIAVIEEGGCISFALRTQDRECFDIPFDAHRRPSDRGMAHQIASLTVRILGVVGAPRLAAAGARWATGAIEARLRPHVLRTFRSGQSTLKAEESMVAQPCGARSALLLIHGINSSSHTTFRFDPSYLDLLHGDDRYGEHVYAFDHPTLCCTPEDNADELRGRLAAFRIDNLDILAHSRGGLVARELLKELPPGIRVRSIVFVATPNAGTPLADEDRLTEMLSVATNLIGLIPDNPITDTLGITLEVLREWVLKPVVGGLPGIAAMRPGSEVLKDLNGRSNEGVTYRAVAADYEPMPSHRLSLRLRDAVMDQVFRGERNDLMVPTRSAYHDKASGFAIEPISRLVLDRSYGVAHSTFWTSSLVLYHLKEWLDPAKAVWAAEAPPEELRDPVLELEEAMRTGDTLRLRAPELLHDESVGLIEDLVGGAMPRRPRGEVARPSPGVVVVLPGIMGTRLDVDGREVWLSPWNLVRGRFSCLRLGDGSRAVVEPVELLRHYLPLVARLAQSWEQVVPFAYDWRLPIADSAGKLGQLLADEGIDLGSTERPVHIVAHSMGGLVARWFLGQNSNLAWIEGNGRLVQLGTPNRGSFALPLALHGDEVLVRALALADVANAKSEILATIASFPSVFEMFPWPDFPPDGQDSHGHAELLDATAWTDLPAAQVATALDHARRFRADLPPLPSGRCVYVAGDGHRTPCRARLEADHDISFVVTSRGDGRVAHDFGHDRLGIRDEDVYYVESNHGDLISDDRVLDALDELLMTGRTQKLAQEPQVSRASEAQRAAPEWIRASAIERSVGLREPETRSRSWSPDADEEGLLDSAAIYVGRPRRGRKAMLSLRVSIAHGSLEQARYPVMAGRYKGIPIEGALGFIDRRFGNALSDLHRAGLYPDEAGTARYVRAPDYVYPRGVILLGLGEFGSLTPEALARAVQRGTSDYALAERRRSGAEPVLGVSAVLVSTPGRYGLTVIASIVAMIRGVARASTNLAGQATIDELEIIELSESRAEEAAAALDRLRHSAELDVMEVDVDINSTIVVRPGGRPGSRGYEESGTPWPRLMLELEAPRTHDPGATSLLRYVSLVRQAQATSLEVPVDVDEIAGHVTAAIQSSSVDPRTNNTSTLFELLLPNEAKLELESFDNLHLLVDESTAWIPWEIIAGRESTSEESRPQALRAGLLRQLKPREGEAPRRPALTSVTEDVLVIGDPPTGPDGRGRLLGAREEARIVADKLRSAGFVVQPHIYDDRDKADDQQARMLVDDFFRRPYRVIHIAAHGRFPEGSTDAGRTGVVIGPDEALLGAVHFRQRAVTPELVFLNCCHVGRIDPARREPRRYSELAASLSLELMRSGVRAVVAAGWAVDDLAAQLFAATFYECLLDGRPFGDAVREARMKAYEGGRTRTNTWAAYQCYGDPDYQLRTIRRRPRPTRIFSAGHLLNELGASAKRAGDAFDPEHIDSVTTAVARLEEQAVGDFDTSAVWTAIGWAYAEAGNFDRAVDACRKVVLHKDSDVSIKTIRDLANFEARLAAQRHREAQDFKPRERGDRERRVIDEPEQLFLDAQGWLEKLAAVDSSAERLVIEGSLFKKWASTMPEDDRRRRKTLVRSRQAYMEACELSMVRDRPHNDGAGDVRGNGGGKTGLLVVYHGCLALLMARAAGATGQVRARCNEYREQLHRQRPMYLDSAGDYFERAQGADIDAATIVYEGKLAEADNVDVVVEGFTMAFRVRSTARQRMSVIDNYWDLSALLPAGERAAAREVAERLETFKPAHGGELV